MVALDITSVVPYLSFYCNSFTNVKRFQETIPKEWVQLVITDSGFLQGIFLASCRHLAEHSHPCRERQEKQQEYYLQLATQYKLACLQTVIKAIAANPTSTHVGNTIIATTIVLALDEVRLP